MEAAIPAQGQLVEVRQRQFVVTDVAKSTLPPDPLAAGDSPPQHVVRLSSVEEDALGEELSVVWELEPGARIHGDRLRLPQPSAEGFDPPHRLDAFVDAVRWGAVTSAEVDVLQSPFRSGITIEDYQLDPVVRALKMPRVNLLVADDVGLGKTIETGLVAQELILRQRARSILVVVPASLQIKWRDEMRDKFGLEFRIVDSQALRELRRRRGIHVNPWTHFPRLITSIDFLKRDRQMRAFREVLPAAGESPYPRRFDLLVVDEAHNVAPAGSGHYAVDSDRTHAIRTLAPHFEHKIFLTATPHNGYPESFSALLELLDDQRFAAAVKPDRKQLEAVMVRRMKTEIVGWDGEPRFPERRLEAIEVDYTDAEREAHALLQNYTSARRRDGEPTRRIATEFVTKLLKKRMFSSPAAFAATLERHEKTLRGIEERDEEFEPVRRRPAPGILRRELERVEDETDDDEQLEVAVDDAVGTASSLFERLGDEDREILRKLKDWGRRASARPDSKAKQLLAWLEATLRPDGDWNDDRVIIFTEYRATQKWLLELFARQGLVSGDRLMTIFGGMDECEREQIKAAFQADPKISPVRILLATDAASEGIDLQKHCHRLVHYEIPWNPNRLEQRNGRIDRHGQPSKHVLVHHFVGQGWDAQSGPKGALEADLEFLFRAAKKVDQIRNDLGKVGPVIATQVEEAMLGHRRSLDTSRAEKDAEPVRRMLTFERKLREQIETLHARLEESRQTLRVAPDTIRSVVEIGLALAGQPALKRAKLPNADGAEAFRLPALRGTWAACREGLAHPHTGEVRAITFDHSLAEGRDDVVLVHLNHRLVQMCQRLLRAEIWASHDRKRLHRVTARIVADDVLDTPAVVAHARLLVLGGSQHRLHEEIVTAGGWLRGGRFVRMNVGQTRSALEAGTDEEPSAKVAAKLADLWPAVEDSLITSLEARRASREKSLDSLLREREAQDLANSRIILEELERAIRTELDAVAPPQLELFSSEEKSQRERNRESLRARLNAIPEQIEREAESLRRRWADPNAQLFPFAVTFLVPHRLAS